MANSSNEIAQLLDEMASKLKLINLHAFTPEGFKEDAIDDLKFLHKMVMKKSHFSPSEMQAIVEEIGSLKVPK